MAKHVWVMQAIYGVSFEEARRMRTENNDRPVQLGQQNLKELRGPLCDMCGSLFDVVVVYDKRGDRVETPCQAAGAKSVPPPEVRFGPEQPDEGEPFRQSESPVSPDQPRLQGDHERTGVARGPERGELRLLPQRFDPAGGTLLLPEGTEPVQQGEPDRVGALKLCRCDGECGDHYGNCRRSVIGPLHMYCETCIGMERK